MRHLTHYLQKRPEGSMRSRTNVLCVILNNALFKIITRYGVCYREQHSTSAGGIHHVNWVVYHCT